MKQPLFVTSSRWEPMGLVCRSCGARGPARRRDEAWIEVPMDDGWVAAYRLVGRRGQPVIAEVRLFPNESTREIAGQWSGESASVPLGGVPGRILRRLRLRDAIELFPQFVANWQRRHGKGPAKAVLGRVRLSTSKAVARRPVGRAGHPDEFYVRWAQAYLDRISAGSPHPVRDLSEDPPTPIEGFVSRGDYVDPETVRAILNRARRRKLLTEAPPGRPGGELTPRALAVLRRQGR